MMSMLVNRGVCDGGFQNEWAYSSAGAVLVQYRCCAGYNQAPTPAAASLQLLLHVQVLLVGKGSPQKLPQELCFREPDAPQNNVGHVPDLNTHRGT